MTKTLKDLKAKAAARYAPGWSDKADAGTRNAWVAERLARLATAGDPPAWLVAEVDFLLEQLID